ncbi:MAG: hypothetical protein AAF199_07925 [Pseudomonadota bacterium]
MSGLRLIIGARVFLALLLTYVTAQSLVPAPDMPDEGAALARWLAALILGGAQHADKITHFLVYALLGFFAGASVPLLPHQLGNKVGRYSVYLLLALSLYGLVLEGIQHLGGVRRGDWADAFANILGAIAGVTAFLVAAWVTYRMVASRDTPWRSSL